MLLKDICARKHPNLQKQCTKYTLNNKNAYDIASISLAWLYNICLGDGNVNECIISAVMEM